MRCMNIHKTATARTENMPFAGLGFAMDDLSAVVQTMTIRYRNQAGCESVGLPTPESVVQPSGYSLLVALGREIRGR